MWTVRTAALDAVIKNYAVICSELEQISKDSCGEPSRKASGLLALMEKFSTYYGLKLSFLVFSATEQLFKTLQSSTSLPMKLIWQLLQLSVFFNG